MWSMSEVVSLHFPNTSQFNNLRGYPLKVFMFAYPPTSFGTVIDDDVFVGTHGIDVQVVRTLSQILNFTSRLTYPGPDLWGYLLPNNTYTGMTLKVQLEEGDMGVANVFVDMNRYTRITYTSPYNFASACFCTPAPRETPKWKSLTFPFTTEVWVAFACTVGVMILLIPAFTRLNVKKDDWKFSNLEISLLYTVAVFTNQSVRQPEKRLRIFVFFLMVMGFVAAVSFSCNLTAYMMAKNYEKPIRTIADLDESGLPVAGFGNIYPDDFRASSNPHLHGIADRYVVMQYSLETYFR
ncbi:glutamate receptor ionotropic, delta-1-like [Oratosquilla oratoria]|uniref:glutamate receptor ionotropic, delta-1-like n=1 Tax=Oratosquilla oratoria TaxID=337810 RepID=UPI003F76EDD7